MAFVGRTAELRRLTAAYASRRSELVVLYGRRRIGKTELLVRSLAGHTGIYYVGKTATTG